VRSQGHEGKGKEGAPEDRICVYIRTEGIQRGCRLECQCIGIWQPSHRPKNETSSYSFIRRSGQVRIGLNGGVEGQSEQPPERRRGYAALRNEDTDME
jgi:hypothetical protein